MQIAILALGSRGDVQPYIALGKGLQAAGHAVRLVSHDAFAALARSHGLAFWPMRGDVQEVAGSAEMRALLEKGNFIAITRYTAREAQRAARWWAEDGLAACAGVDLLIAGIGGLHIGIALAEKLNIPLVQAYVTPFTPTATLPTPLAPTSLPALPGALNRLSHHAARQLMWQGFRAADAQARRQVLGLPAAPFAGPYNAPCLRDQPVLYGFSPAVIAPPPDWDMRTHVTGYWFLDAEEDWSPPPALADFLENGPPPVYIGFGSMISRDPAGTAALVLQALAHSGQRALLAAGWGGLHQAELPDNVLMLEAAPHAWLFPRMAAVVHHGGAGTTAAGLVAGVPSIIVPFFGDQPFWGQRVARLGVGPDPIPRKELTAARLARALDTALADQDMRRRAAALGERIAAEDGMGRAATIVGTLGR